MTKFQEELKSMGAFDELIAVAENKTASQFWETCDSGSLLMSYAAIKKIDDRLMVAVAVEHAKLAEHFMADPRSINALRVGERYGRGEATIEELRIAENKSRDASLSAALSDTDSVDAADAVFFALCAGTSLDDFYAAYAVYAAASAVAENFCSQAYEAARDATQKKCADICRKMISVELFNFENSSVV